MAGSIAYTIPPLTTPGPQYATQVDAALTAIQAHTHDGVNAGATIDIAAQACGEDLSIAHHNLTNVRSVQFDNEPAALTGSQDVLNIYVNQGNLFYNNSDGTPIQLTAGTTPAPSGIDVLNWIMRANGTPVTAAFSILATDLYNVIALNSASGSFTGTLPISAAITPTAVGRLYIFRDATGSCGTHPVTIQVAPASGDTFEDDGSTAFVMNSKNAYLAIYTDGHGKWFTWSQNVYQNETIGLTGTALNVSNSSSMTVDASSSLGVVGGIFLQNAGIHELLNASNIVRGGTLSVDTGAITTYSGGAAEVFASGTAETFQTGSTLNLNAGSTTASAGTLNVSGTTTVSGTTSLTGTGLTLSGVMNVTGEISGSAVATIINAGATQLYSEAGVLQILSNGTYTVDSSQLDNMIGILSAAGGTVVLLLPASPATGRRLRIFCADVFTSGGTVTLNGNGKNVIGAATFGILVTSWSSSTIKQWSIDIVYNGTQWCAYAALNITI